MNREILISAAARETRAAVLEDGVLQELYVEYAAARGLVGNLYRGKVVRIIDGMQAAFVDIGLTKNAFLPVTGLPRAQATIEDDAAGQKQTIDQLLHEGQRLIVQVDMDSRGDKAARLTTRISIPSRCLVYLPNGSSIGISNKIQSKRRQQQLNSWLETERQNIPLSGGFIVRTEAEQATDDEIRQDLRHLQKTWQAIESAEADSPAIGQIYQAPTLSLRLLHDSSMASTMKVITDSQYEYAQAQEVASNVVSNCKPSIELYSGRQPLFSKYKLEQAIENVLQRKVALPSGGEIIVDYTEALTVIDVNTSSFTGQSGLQQTVLQTNLEAAVEIARQLRLRNIGGIIVVDFINMENARNSQKVVDALKRELRADSVSASVANVSPLGLVEITRQQKHASLVQQTFQSCDICNGSGLVKNARSLCFEILHDLRRQDQQYQARAYTIIAAHEVIEILEHTEAESLAEVRSTIAGRITLQQDRHQIPGHYEIVLG